MKSKPEKTPRTKSLLLIMVLMTVAIMVTCNRDASITDLGGTSESTSANIAGTMYNSDGSRAKTAIVRFVPADFDAYSTKDTAAIESTLTDNNGRYAFTIKSSGYYNISTQKNNASAFEDSVYVSTSTKAVVNDTLKPPGSFSGIVRLEVGDDNRQIVILVLGTNTYCAPEDTSGSFSIAALAEGDYVLRFLTIDPDYGYTDTVISIVSGQTTTIGNEVHLPYEGVPAVGPVAMNYDSNMMYVSLSWPKADTSKVAGFYIYEKPSYSGVPYAVVNNTDTTFMVDVLKFSCYSFPISYSVAAVGKNRSIGKLSTTSPFYPKTIFLPLDTISCKPLTALSVATVHTICGCPAVFMGGPGWIARYDSTGMLVKEHIDSDNFDITSVAGFSSYAPVCYSNITADSSGNVYAIERYQTGWNQTTNAILTKFTPDLEPVATAPLGWYRDSINQTIFPFKISGDGNGHLHLFYEMYDGALPEKTVVITYNALLEQTGIDTIPEYCPFPDILNDTVYIAGSLPGSNNIVSYDIWGSQIAKWDIASMKTGDYPVLPYTTVQEVFRLASGAMLMGVGQTDMVLTDRDFKLKGRYRLDNNAAIIGSSGTGLIYVNDNSINATLPVTLTNIVIYSVQ